MPPMPLWTAGEWALMLGALGGLVASLVASLRVLAETAEIRARLHRAEETASQTLSAAADASAQTRTNHGSSMRDAIDRLEGSVSGLRREFGVEIGGLRKDIGRVTDQVTADRAASRAADADMLHRLASLEQERN